MPSSISLTPHGLTSEGYAEIDLFVIQAKAGLARVPALGDCGFGLLHPPRDPYPYSTAGHLAVLMPFALIWLVKGVRATALLSRLATEGPTSQCRS